MALSYGVDARVRADHDTEAARSDVEIVVAINNGDAAAFEVLYFRHRDWVAGLAFRFTADNDASLDVMQETFLCFLRKFPGFRLTANLRSFLYSAVRHLAIAARQKAARYQTTAAELEQLEHLRSRNPAHAGDCQTGQAAPAQLDLDRKSTRLNS